jgi:multidrug efflux pump subunit AcrB
MRTNKMEIKFSKQKRKPMPVLLPICRKARYIVRAIIIFSSSISMASSIGMAATISILLKKNNIVLVCSARSTIRATNLNHPLITNINKFNLHHHHNHLLLLRLKNFV